jgi:PAS domain S-box-containing protein
MSEGKEMRSAQIAGHSAVHEQPEVALSASVTLSDAIFNSHPSRIAVVDQNGQIIAVNRAWHEFAVKNGGTPQRTGIGVNYLDICANAHGHSSEGADTCLAGLQQVLAGRIPEFEMDYPCHAPSGEQWFALRAVPLKIQARGMVISHTNITHSVVSEREMKENKQFVETLINTIPEIIYIYDLKEKRNAYVNKGIDRLLGYSEAEIQALGNEVLIALMHPDDFQTYLRDIVPRYAQLPDGEIIEHHYRMRHQDGSWHWLASKETVFTRQPDGAPRQLFGMAGDVTAPRLATEKLKASEERFALAVEASNTGIWDWQIGTEQVYYSPRWKSILGHAPHEIDNRFEEWEKRLHPDDKERMLTAVADFLDNPIGNFDHEFRMRHKDGSYRWILNRSAAQVGGDGRPTRMFGSHLDITNQKQIEEALRESEQQLKQRAAALAASNLELEQFAYVASHDLQEPLRMITSYLQLLERRYSQQLDQEALEFIGYAVNGAMQMRTLISDLLKYSRVGTRGKEFQPVDSEIVLQRVLSSLLFALEENQAVVTYSPLPTVMADEVQLAQLFQNLISNALKFTASSPPQILVGADPEVDRGQWRFRVQDNGIGIETRFHERIFEVFQRLHNREAYPGTGIGLAICKRIVERHGGRIWLESTVGKGTVFYFTLPAV